MAEFTEKPGSADAGTQRELSGSVSVLNGDCGLAPDLSGSTGADNASDSKPGIPRKASIIKFSESLLSRHDCELHKTPVTFARFCSSAESFRLIHV
ncbi:inactive phospholipase C-like protein 2 [Tachysurus ichikawai]